MTPKFCPFINRDCLTEKCACYTKTFKPVYRSRSQGITDPRFYYRYIGCGLVKAIPWQLIDSTDRSENELENIEK
ncbi:MAG: hypothetical protein N3D85_07820 [Candidatus Bathyarchaeota archaeon]|nr:hypothetical protein [Candidatus Bathyarchaeota archaeon]